MLIIFHHNKAYIKFSRRWNRPAFISRETFQNYRLILPYSRINNTPQQGVVSDDNVETRFLPLLLATWEEYLITFHAQRF